MKCSFCGEEMERGTGVTFVKRDGTMFNFCSQKCKRNMLKLKRNPRKLKWTAKYKA